MKESQSRVKKRSEERDDLETIKAAAWAVFQHNNGGGSNTNRHLGAALMLPTRFKIEAQMKMDRERRSAAKQAPPPTWDTGSTLFDKYELDSVLKHLDFAFQSVEKQQQRLSSEAYEYNDDHPEQDWLEAVGQSQRFRGSYLESVDESLPLANNAKISMELVDGICKDVPQGKKFKSMQLMLTPNRWNVLSGRRCSFDTDAQLMKESKQSRKSKLLAIFKSKSKDGSRVMPDDLRKTKTKDSSRRKDDSDSSDGYPVKTFSRAVRLSRDMSNPNVEQGLRDHLRHGSLSYGQGAGAGAAPPPRRKGTYSLNVTTPAPSPRRSMLNGSRDDLEEEFHHHHHYHHHHHHHIDGDDDYELTVQDIERRASRKSFEEMAARRLSMEDHLPSAGGLKVPRNSLESLFVIESPTPGSKLFL